MTFSIQIRKSEHPIEEEMIQTAMEMPRGWPCLQTRVQREESVIVNRLTRDRWILWTETGHPDDRDRPHSRVHQWMFVFVVVMFTRTGLKLNWATMQ